MVNVPSVPAFSWPGKSKARASRQRYTPRTAMPQIRYRLHFLTLIPAALVFWLLSMLLNAMPAESGATLLTFGAMGVLHATSLAISLRGRPAAMLGKTVIFVTRVGLLSVVTVFSPLLLVPFMKLFGIPPVHRDTLVALLFPAFASAFGASGYWLLLRSFWLKSRKLVGLIPTVALCSLATLVSWPSGAKTTSLGRDIADLIPTFGWWVAFSLSLYFGDRLQRSEKSTSVRPQDARA